jgi:hypothetical protein
VGVKRSYIELRTQITSFKKQSAEEIIWAEEGCSNSAIQDIT